MTDTGTLGTVKRRRSIGAACLAGTLIALGLTPVVFGLAENFAPLVGALLGAAAAAHVRTRRSAPEGRADHAPDKRKDPDWSFSVLFPALAGLNLIGVWLAPSYAWSGLGACAVLLGCAIVHRICWNRTWASRRDAAGGR